MAKGRKPDYRACCGVTEKEPENGQKPKTFWRDVGAGWKTENGGINVQLEAFPVDGQFMLFPNDK